MMSTFVNNETVNMTIDFDELAKRSKNWKMKTVPENEGKSLSTLYYEGKLKSPGARRLALEQIAQKQNLEPHNQLPNKDTQSPEGKGDKDQD